MNEEQAVLDFFSQDENLSLALIAADCLDAIRLRLNNELWESLQERLDVFLTLHSLPWTTQLTEDRTADDCLVGIYLQPLTAPNLFLRPFMEQQFIGDSYRIYHGLMWSDTPSSNQKNLPGVASLHNNLLQAGFKESDNFFAWQWLPWYPRRRNFLLNFTSHREKVLGEVVQPWHYLLLTFGEQLHLANLALGGATNGVGISLDMLRSKLPSQSS